MRLKQWRSGYRPSSLHRVPSLATVGASAFDAINIELQTMGINPSTKEASTTITIDPRPELSRAIPALLARCWVAMTNNIPVFLTMTRSNSRSRT